MRVIVAVGGGEGAAYFRRVAVVAPLDRAAEVLLVHVIDERRRGGVEMGRHGPLGRPLALERAQEIEGAEREWAARAVGEARAALAAAGVAESVMRDVIRYGRPKEEIRDLAVETAATLIVVGARRGDKPGPHSLGKTARFLVDHAPAAALMVRPAD